MIAPPETFLDVLAATLRQQIGPAVGEPFAKTQAFMAAVILEKLAGQLRAAAGDALADADERAALIVDLRAILGPARTPHLSDALDVLVRDGSDGRWSALVEALYAERDALGMAQFGRLLDRVRIALRGRLDRRLAYAS